MAAVAKDAPASRAMGAGRDRQRGVRRDGARHGLAVWGVADLEVVHAAE
jgi:hypothetical protein